MGNSGRFFYNACTFGDKNCTATIAFDLTAKSSMTIALSGHTLYKMSPDGQKFIAEQNGVGIYAKEIDKPDRIFLKIKFYYKELLWLQDSQHIIYITEMNGERYIYTALWDGSNPMPLSKKGDKPFKLSGLTTGEDGTRIHFERADILSANSWRPLGSKWINLETGEQGDMAATLGTDYSFSPTNRYIAYWDYKKSLILQMNADEPKRLIGQNSINPNILEVQMLGTLIWSADNARLFSSIYKCTPACDKTNVYIFSTETGSLIAEFPQFTGMLNLVSISPDGRLGLLFGHENSKFASKPILYMLDMETLGFQRLDTVINLPYPFDGWHANIGWLPALSPTQVSHPTTTPAP